MTVIIERNNKTWVAKVESCPCGHSDFSHFVSIKDKDGQIRCKDCPVETSICARVQY